MNHILSVVPETNNGVLKQGGDAGIGYGDASAYRVERECDFDFRLRILPNDDGELAELRLDGFCSGCGGLVVVEVVTESVAVNSWLQQLRP